MMFSNTKRIKQLQRDVELLKGQFRHLCVILGVETRGKWFAGIGEEPFRLVQTKPCACCGQPEIVKSSNPHIDFPELEG